ncbi:50S ribosomal protein L6 [Patescibacteria group bacterium]|nr:MAG: 50S ribosomal protein L6 [Patescibacteria group bacterium]
MSRIGKKIIVIPEKVTVSVSGNTVVVKGPLGETSRTLPPSLNVVASDSQLRVEPRGESPGVGILRGTYASHVTNMVRGVTEGFSKKLVVEGIGYRVELKGDKLQFALGFSHPVEVPIPAGLSITVEKNVLTVSGVGKELVTEFAARLRSLKKPEPYKGKGIRYQGEVIKLKQGKKAVA